MIEGTATFRESGVCRDKVEAKQFIGVGWLLGGKGDLACAH